MPRPRKANLDARGDLLWKWICRLAALAAFAYVLIAKDGNVPLGAYVLIGGLAGLPNILGLQQMLNRSSDGDE